MHHSFSLLVQESCRQGDGIASYIFFVMNLQARSAGAVDLAQGGCGTYASFDVCRTQMLKAPLRPGLTGDAQLVLPADGNVQSQTDCVARQHRATVRGTSIAGLPMVSPSLKAMVYVCR